MSYSRFIPTAAAAALVLAGASPAFADDAVPPTKAVHYGDLDLTSDAGVTQLKRRIQVAALDVCGVRKAQTTGEKYAANKCRYRALTTAKGHVGTVVAMARTGNRYASADVR